MRGHPEKAVSQIRDGRVGDYRRSSLRYLCGEVGWMIRSWELFMSVFITAVPVCVLLLPMGREELRVRRINFVR